MALIVCPNCGKEISNKTDICPHCNFNIIEYNKKLQEEKERNKKEKVKCPECGKLVDKKDEKCPFCGYPIQFQKKKRKKVIIPAGIVLIVIVLIFIIGSVIKSNSVESRIIGMWSCLNKDSIWNFQFDDDFTGKFVGYKPNSNAPAVNYNFTWTYDKEKTKIVIVNTLTGKVQNSLEIIEFENDDTILADIAPNGERKLTKGYFNYDAIVSEYGSYKDSDK